MTILPGSRLGPYAIVAPLGAGGMGEVYRARDTRLGRDVAIKVLPQHAPTAAEDRARFEREAKTISSLNHPHICVLHDVGREGDTDYFVMELIEGETLARRVSRGPLSDADVLRIGIQIADALGYAHRAGVVHRDLKPGNIMLTSAGAKLMDFGLARGAKPASRGADDETATQPQMRASEDEFITAKGAVVGTIQYMAPEQLDGKRADARSDIWALGCVLYEMATGRQAFTGSSAASIISAIMRDKPRTMAELSPPTPPALQQLVEACLAKDPEQRIQTAHDLKLQLTWIADAGSRPAMATARASGRRTGAVRSLVVVISMFLLFVAGWLLWTTWGREKNPAGVAADIQRIPVLVAEFEGPATDPNLTAAARKLVMAGFDQSNRFESVPLIALRQALRSAGESDSTHIDAALARELAFRSAIKVVVEGRIDRLGNAFSVVLTARDADRGQALHTVTGSADREEGLIKTLGDLTADLRARLGERSASLVSGRIRWLAATPSFEAYRKYTEGFDLQQMRGDDRGSLVLINDALRIDPDFAEAWALKGFAYGHLGEHDSSAIALDEALKRPTRLTEEGRMFLQGLQHNRSGDFASADATYRELIRRGYQLSSSLGNHGHVLMSAGRYREALQQYERAARVNSIGPQQWVLHGEISLLLMFGEVDKARSAARQLQGPHTDGFNIAIDVAAGDWQRADSVAAAILQDPIRAENSRTPAEGVRMALAGSRGSIRSVREYLKSARSRAEALGRPDLEDEILETELLVDTAFGPSEPPPQLRWNKSQSQHGIVVRGLLAAERGDLGRAKEALRLVAGSAPRRPLLEEPTRPDRVLAAWLDGMKGQWAESARKLGVVARHGESTQPALSPVTVRLLAARAFEECQSPDSAAAYYELALDPSGLWVNRRVESKLVSSFVHQRLAAIYARLGRDAEARRHREAFLKDFTAPDPELKRLRDIAQAR